MATTDDGGFTKRIVVGGLPRSGSTLLRFVMDASPNLLSCHETAFFLLPFHQQQRRINRSAPNLAETLDLPEKFVRQVIQQTYSGQEAFDLLMARYANTADKTNARTWVEKSPMNCFHYHRLAYELDNVFFISTIRNGLDVVTSIVNDHPKRCNEYWCSPQRYVEASAAISQFRDDRHLIIRYENMVDNPKETFRKLFDFIGEHFDASYLTDFRNETPSRSHSKVHQPKLAEPIQTRWVGRWNKPGHREQIRLFLDHPQAPVWMKHFGYESSLAQALETA